MNKWLLIALGVAGIGAIVFVLRENSASGAQSQVLPIPTAAPPQIPQYPPAPPLPAFVVNATPTYQTINIQPHDEPQAQIVNTPNCPPKCDNCDQTGVTAVNVPKISQSRVNFSRENLASVPNIQAQFPPALYPWLYQKGGTA